MITVPVGHSVTRYRQEIEKAALEKGIDPNLVSSLIYVTSKGDPQYSNEQGGVGLMGLNANNAGAAPELKDPQNNLEVGTALLAALWHMSAGASNRLETAVIRYLGLNGVTDQERVAKMTSEILALYRGAPSEADTRSEYTESWGENQSLTGLPLPNGFSVDDVGITF
jgi:soluble lytic murein transglycosylase-like protein